MFTKRNQTIQKVSALSPKKPVAPPAYRPQPVPKVLQTKKDLAPPVNKPKANNVTQPKALPPTRPLLIARQPAIPRAVQLSTRPNAAPAIRNNHKLSMPFRPGGRASHVLQLTQVVD